MVKNPPASAGDMGLIPGLGRSPGGGNGTPLQYSCLGNPTFMIGFLGTSNGKESACSAGELGLIPGLGRSPEKEKGYPLQYSALGNSMDCSLPGSSYHAILEARILEWVAVPLFRGSSQPRDQTQVFLIAGGFFTSEPPRKPI